ncbi:hypothetical protein BOTNAR_0193g00010 [Botryotinia narcissicola]|uniref:Uncharacterized protein n=1 Tax=Botryotinia narcissicola TaxID=278944 RepID=A0A4Z1I8Q7_9HELO|nr:hypothetical protein BOTNAR_0193g00010 [Botryotinia narcissicola]
MADQPPQPPSGPDAPDKEKMEQVRESIFICHDTYQSSPWLIFVTFS